MRHGFLKLCTLLQVFATSLFSDIQSEWVHHWAEGCRFYSEENFSQASEQYRLALQKIEQDKAECLQIYQEIETVYQNLSLRNLPYLTETKTDSQEPLSRVDGHVVSDYIIIKPNKRLSHADLAEISQILVEREICSTEEEATLSPSGFLIVHCPNYLNLFCPSIRLKNPGQSYASVNSDRAERCKGKCNTAAYYAGLLCTRLPKNCSLVCLVLVEPLRLTCEVCCRTGDFYQHCIQPLEKFFPPPCDPSWD